MEGGGEGDPGTGSFFKGVESGEQGARGIKVLNGLAVERRTEFLICHNPVCHIWLGSIEICVIPFGAATLYVEVKTKDWLIDTVDIGYQSMSEETTCADHEIVSLQWHVAEVVGIYPAATVPLDIPFHDSVARHERAPHAGETVAQA